MGQAGMTDKLTSLLHGLTQSGTIGHCVSDPGLAGGWRRGTKQLAEEGLQG
jgi:hypothetical protein